MPSNFVPHTCDSSFLPDDCVVQRCGRRCRVQSALDPSPPLTWNDPAGDGRNDPGGPPKTGSGGRHRKACTMAEFEETQCLNGGSCFAVELHNGMRRAGCRSVGVGDWEAGGGGLVFFVPGCTFSLSFYTLNYENQQKKHFHTLFSLDKGDSCSF